jgi:hypothetical protein
MGTVLSVNPWKSLVSMVKMATWVMVFLAAREVFNSERDIKAVSVWAGLCCLVIIVSYFASRFGLIGAASLSYKKWGMTTYTGGFSGPTGISLPLVMAIPAILTVSWGNLTWLRRSIVGLSIVVILFSYLRSALVMVAAGYIAFAYYAIRYQGGRLGATLILPVFAFLVLGASAAAIDSGQVFKRWTSTAEQLEEKDYSSVGSGRVGLIENAIDFYFNRQELGRMIFGNGLGNSWIATRSGKVAHNDFAEILIGCGVVGFLLYGAFLFTLGTRLRKIIVSGRERIHATAGCLAMFSFIALLAGHFRGVSQAVFPLTIMAIHIGAVMGARSRARVSGQGQATTPDVPALSRVY